MRFLLNSLSIAALLLLSAPVQAQQQEITAADVEGYVDQIRKDAAEMMEAEDPRQLIEWAQRNIAESATFQVNLSIFTGEERKAYSSMTLETQDVLRMVRVLAGAFEQGAFEDYSLEADVSDVVSHGPGAATATIRWRESFTLNAAGLFGDGGQMAQGEGIEVNAVTTCSHLIRRDQDQLQLGLSTCTVEMRL